MSEQRQYRVRYWFGPYEGEVTVCTWDREADNEQIIATAKRQLRPHMSLPMAYERYEVIHD